MSPFRASVLIKAIYICTNTYEVIFNCGLLIIFEIMYIEDIANILNICMICIVDIWCYDKDFSSIRR